MKRHADCDQQHDDLDTTESRLPTDAETVAIEVLTGTTPTGRVRMKVSEWQTVARVVAAMAGTATNTETRGN